MGPLFSLLGCLGRAVNHPVNGVSRPNMFTLWVLGGGLGSSFVIGTLLTKIFHLLGRDGPLVNGKDGARCRPRRCLNGKTSGRSAHEAVCSWTGK